MRRKQKLYNFIVKFWDDRNQQSMVTYEVEAINALQAQEIAIEELKKDNQEWLSREYDIKIEMIGV